MKEALARVKNEVYPRVRGGTMMRCAAASIARGLSPRARGNLERLRNIHRAQGSIPACAGEPSGGAAPMQPSKVYPRVRGGTHRDDDPGRETSGLSPRARGNLLQTIF